MKDTGQCKWYIQNEHQEETAELNFTALDIQKKEINN